MAEALTPYTARQQCVLHTLVPSQSAANGYQLCTFMHGVSKAEGTISVCKEVRGMKNSYTQNKGTIRYNRSKDYKEFSLSFRRTRRVRKTTSRNRPRQSRIWGIVLTIIKLGLEVAAKLIGSGKSRIKRPLPELRNEIQRKKHQAFSNA